MPSSLSDAANHASCMKRASDSAMFSNRKNNTEPDSGSVGITRGESLSCLRRCRASDLRRETCFPSELSGRLLQQPMRAPRRSTRRMWAGPSPCAKTCAPKPPRVVRALCSSGFFLLFCTVVSLETSLSIWALMFLRGSRLKFQCYSPNHKTLSDAGTSFSP